MPAAATVARWPYPELLHPEDLIWPVGINNFRIQYTAGYATVPENVQEACAEWVSAVFWQTKRDPGLSQEAVPGVLARWPFSAMPSGVRALLLPYKDRKVA